MPEPKTKARETPRDAPGAVPDGNKGVFDALLRQAIPEESKQQENGERTD